MAHTRVRTGPVAFAPVRKWRRSLRRVLDHVLWCLARSAIHVFFREIQVTGEPMPAGGRLMIVANHTNSVIDGVLLLGLWGTHPRVLAKSTLFSHPVMAPLLGLIGALPVYRRQDQGEDVSRNLDTFARCVEALAEGESIAMFPEGTSHNQRHALPLKTGAARIALQAEASGDPLGVRIVPVGFSYEAKQRFRSRLRVEVGKPIDPAQAAARDQRGHRAAVRDLTEVIARGMRAVTSSGFAVAEPGVEGAKRRSRAWLATNPVFVLGWALNWLPYRLPGYVADRFSTTADEPATYKLLTGLLAFPLAWAAEAFVAARVGGMGWGLAIAVLAPTTGYAALRIWETRRTP